MLQPDGRLPTATEVTMFEFLKQYMDSLVGVTELSRDKAEKMVKDLQKRGEVRAQDIRKTAEELVNRSMRNRKELVGLVQKEIKRQVHALGLATRQDVDKLAKRVKTLESGAKSTAKKKSAAKKKTTSSKSTGSSGSN